MKRTITLAAAALVLGLGPGCKDPQLASFEHSACLTGKAVIGAEAVNSGLECFEYEYSAGMLTVRHLNALFNCCPDRIEVDPDIGETAIVVEEEEIEGAFGMCACMCPYNLEAQLSDIPAGPVEVTMGNLGPYALDLSEGAAGRFCLEHLVDAWWCLDTGGTLANRGCFCEEEADCADGLTCAPGGDGSMVCTDECTTDCPADDLICTAGACLPPTE